MVICLIIENVLWKAVWRAVWRVCGGCMEGCVEGVWRVYGGLCGQTGRQGVT